MTKYWRIFDFVSPFFWTCLMVSNYMNGHPYWALSELFLALYTAHRVYQWYAYGFAMASESESDE